MTHTKNKSSINKVLRKPRQSWEKLFEKDKRLIKKEPKIDLVENIFDILEWKWRQ